MKKKEPIKYTIVTQLPYFYLNAASVQAHLAYDLWKSSSSGKLNEIHPLAVASVICSACYVEASINALFTSSWGQRSRFRAALASVWSDGFDRQETLSKYQIALVLAGKKSFETDAAPYQAAHALVKLRNHIAHPKSEWSDGKDAAKLRSLLDKKYPFSELGQDHSYSFFPTECLSPLCGAWAVSTAEKFVSSFFDRLPVSARPTFRKGTEAALGLKAAKLLKENMKT